MKRFTKFMAIFMATALIMSIAAVSASAATVTGPAAIDFTKYMVIDDDANIPNAQISFAIQPGTAIAADSDSIAVLAGPAGATVGTVTFSPADTEYDTVQTGDDVTLGANQVYAKRTGTIDLSGVTFTEPGVYRYELTETDPNISGMTADSRTLYLDVYVTSDANGDLTVSSTVLHTSAAAPARNANSGSADVSTDSEAVADKVTGFTNTYDTKDLTFSKTVTGNQGSRDKYFAFTVVIGNATAGDKFTVDLTNADANIAYATLNAATTVIDTDITQPNELTVGQGGTVTQVYYLHDGQSINVQGLPMTATYTVYENREDYTSAVAVTGDVDASDDDEHVDYTDTDAAVIGASGTVDANDGDTITVGLTNTKDGVIPTGVLLMITPFAVGILLFGTLMFFMISKRRREAY